MDPRWSTFGTTLADAAMAQDWNAVHGLLAPWMRKALTPDSVRAFFENAYREILAGFDVEELHHPTEAELDGNSCTLADLREDPFRPDAPEIADEVTDENFRKWMHIQLMTSPEQQAELGMDYLASFWLIIVELREGLRVGYWAHAD